MGEEGIQMNPAGFWKRFLAYVLEFIIVGIPLYLLGRAIAIKEIDILIELLSALYWLLTPIFWYGYTIGRRIMGIRIVKIDGSNVGLGTMILRMWVAGLVYGITLGIGCVVSIIMVAFREDKRAIHDFIAGTYVTTDKPGF